MKARKEVCGGGVKLAVGGGVEHDVEFTEDSLELIKVEGCVVVS